jgi:hypothetical protein
MDNKLPHRYTFILTADLQQKLEKLSHALGLTSEETVARAISDLYERIDPRSQGEEHGTVRMTEEQVRRLLCNL